MIYRLWTTGVDPTQIDRYREFADSRSLPMFREQQGFREAFFLQDGDEHWVLTVWDSLEDIEALGASDTYAATVRALGESGILTGKQTVRILRTEVV
ncbi:antibiotic biosynthesis monooxygenase family protein [Nocardioides astragali]|uniref:Antibiotic biosynthesis monooxygenase family protein n=1 Tax=Nocardioides astragali TaxID=1776736 RepID=A0ABW2N6V4_9ACTN|nr:antibiotic biosynthesis monooxygenase [Nocardioides astragali]